MVLISIGGKHVWVVAGLCPILKSGGGTGMVTISMALTVDIQDIASILHACSEAEPLTLDCMVEVTLTWMDFGGQFFFFPLLFFWCCPLSTNRVEPRKPGASRPHTCLFSGATRFSPACHDVFCGLAVAREPRTSYLPRYARWRWSIADVQQAPLLRECGCDRFAPARAT
jgi:hypothetical protein